MHRTVIEPRFYETDAFGHINNTVIAGWFETGRRGVFELFSSDMDPRNLNLILARIEIDFVAQTYYGSEVEIRTWVERIGRTSFTVSQEAWQNDQCVARGQAVQVHFDWQTQAPAPLSEDQKAALAAL
ncbi:acyl-CoA thioesterase [Isoalcanivorax beigongshangi]|uniref:Acyl-CoA thioesterase n=1 Tax=Isoalcanivorax beigongshangi TaxID=3238810 RepID=A0ABV4AHU9_9GAMM